LWRTVFFKGALTVASQLGGMGLIIAALGAISLAIGLAVDYVRSKTPAKKVKN